MLWGSRRCVVLIFGSALCVLVTLGWQRDELVSDLVKGFRGTTTTLSSFVNGNVSGIEKRNTILNVLVESGAYTSNNFSNEHGIIPPFWSASNTTSPCKPDQTTTVEVGPCFGTHHTVDWEQQVQLFRDNPHVSYNKAPVLSSTTPEIRNDWAGHCRPGFLIIGAGKCGTSSLYHYLTEHPRVLPAKEKQIHYFKYYSNRPMKWYLHHFPTVTSFLATGAMMTGEASPGYLPYPEVVTKIQRRLPGAQTKFIAIGRNPLERAYSSYRYNYVTPTTASLKQGKVKTVPAQMEDEDYEQYLFSFQEMMEAELHWLQKCLSVPNGSAVSHARNMYGPNEDWKPEFERRASLGKPPLTDLDGGCYGESVDRRIPREQWLELMTKNPEKVIPTQNVHLTQSFIGRSLYVLPLEWWYAIFEPSELYFVCTEELQDMSGKPLDALGQFLGLPSFNFSSTVQKGAFNVGGHRGYDKEISWKDYASARKKDEKRVEIPLTDDFREKVETFLRPYNERLFELVGRRCDWS